MNLVYSIPITEYRLIWQYLFNERINNSNRKCKDGYVEEHRGKATTQELAILSVKEQNEMSSFTST